jgi:hypothetical protein
VPIGPRPSSSGKLARPRQQSESRHHLCAPCPPVLDVFLVVDWARLPVVFPEFRESTPSATPAVEACCRKLRKSDLNWWQSSPRTSLSHLLANDDLSDFPETTCDFVIWPAGLALAALSARRSPHVGRHLAKDCHKHRKSIAASSNAGILVFGQFLSVTFVGVSFLFTSLSQ